MTEDENKTRKKKKHRTSVDPSSGGDPGDSLYVLAESEGDENQLWNL